MNSLAVVLFRQRTVRSRLRWHGVTKREIVRIGNQPDQLHVQIAADLAAPGVGVAVTWKTRVIYPQLGGKRSGLRYVYERITIDERKTLSPW